MPVPRSSCPTASSTARASRTSSTCSSPIRLGCARWGQAARTLGRTDATARFADLVEEVAPWRALSTNLDLSVPRTMHIVGLGGSIMSAFAAVLVRMGHRVSGSDLRDSRDARTPARARCRRACRSRRRQRPRRRRCGHRVDGDRAVEPRGPARARARRARLQPRRHATCDRGAAAHGRGRREPRQDHDVLDARADPPRGRLAPELPHRWRPQRGRHERVVGRRRVARRRSRRERRDVPRVRARGRDRHQRRSRSPDALGRLSRARRRVRALPRRDVPGRGSSPPTTRSPPASRAERRDEVVTFGFADDADYQIRDYAGKRNGSQFVLARRGQPLGVVELPVPGRHNAKNAAAAAAMAMEIGVPFEAVRAALGGFGGVARRFQFRGERDGVTFVDDYAHLPGEVSHMIDAAREGDWEHVIVVFQPHRYTRTAALWRDFADSFDGADTVVLTDVYGFNETPQPGVSGRLDPPRGARRAPGAAGRLPPAARRPRRARAEARAIRRRRADARRRRSHDRARRVVGARGMNAVDTSEAVAVELERALPGAVERDVPLAALTTYHLGGPVSHARARPVARRARRRRAGGP